MSPRSTPAFPPSLADWEDHKPIIKQLYVGEDRSLSQVQQILCQQYHFKSSLRSYKNKLRLWNIRKYYRTQSPNTHSPEFLFDRRSARPPHLKTEQLSGFIKVEEDDLTTVSSSQIDSPATVATEDPSRQRDESSCESFTPSQENQQLVKVLPDSVAPSPGLFLNENLLDSAEFIIAAARELTTMTSYAESVPLSLTDTSLRQNKPFRRRKDYIWYQFQHSLKLLEQGNISSAFETLQRGCAMAEGYLSHPNRRVLLSLSSVMGNPRWSEHPQAWLSILRFMASMSFKTLGPRHPLTYILIRMRSWDVIRTVAQPTIEAVLDINVNQLGPSHPETLMLKQTLSVEMMRRGDFDGSEALILQACDSSIAAHGQSSLARRNCLRRLGNLYVEQERWAEAESVFENVITLDSAANGYWGPHDETSVFTCQNLSLVNYRKGDLLRSEYWAEQELALAKLIYGPEDEDYVDCLRRRTARMNGEPVEQWFSWLEVS